MSSVCMVWYGMVWYGMVWYGMVWYGIVMVWYGIVMVWCGVVCKCIVWYGMVWYCMVLYGKVGYVNVWYVNEQRSFLYAHHRVPPPPHNTKSTRSCSEGRSHNVGIVVTWVWLADNTYCNSIYFPLFSCFMLRL